MGWCYELALCVGCKGWKGSIQGQQLKHGLDVNLVATGMHERLQLLGLHTLLTTLHHFHLSAQLPPDLTFSKEQAIL